MFKYAGATKLVQVPKALVVGMLVVPATTEILNAVVFNENGVVLTPNYPI